MAGGPVTAGADRRRRRRQSGQMGVFLLTVTPALLLMIGFAHDAAAILNARTAADEIAVSLSRYVAADAAQLGCDPNSLECRGRSRQCSGAGVGAGVSYFDDQVVAAYNVADASEVALGSKPGFDALVARLPDRVFLEEVAAAAVPPAGTAPAGVRVVVTLRREGLMSEALLGSDRVSRITGEAIAAMYVAHLDASSTDGEAPIAHVCV